MALTPAPLTQVWESEWRAERAGDESQNSQENEAMERTQERDNSPLSTADVAAAAEGGKPDETGSPKYVEGEEMAAAAKAAPGTAPAPAESTPLLPEDNLHDLRSRWSDIQ